MSKTVYYIGAGASYGKRNSSGDILEGIPIVAEIPLQFDSFREYIANAVIQNGKITFNHFITSSSEDVTREKEILLRDIESLQVGIREHATIDTYARKLYLTGNKLEFEKLKDVLCLFFIWEQLMNKPDKRYDTFFANVLQSQTLSLPSELSIISWNYDSQLEIAYKAYNSRKDLPIFEKNIDGEWPDIINGGRIFKVNGSATFANKTIIPWIQDDKQTTAAVQLIQYYTYVRSDTRSLGFQFKTHLSFAWESSKNQQNMQMSIQKTVEDAEQVVVIGYSFPFFNRETDRTIFGSMPHLKKIYVQDITPDTVIQSIAAVLLPGSDIKVIPITDCTQFYLPAEL